MILIIMTVLSGGIGIFFMTLMCFSASSILRAGGYTKNSMYRFLIRAGIGVVSSTIFVVSIIIQSCFLT